MQKDKFGLKGFANSIAKTLAGTEFSEKSVHTRIFFIVVNSWQQTFRFVALW